MIGPILTEGARRWEPRGRSERWSRGTPTADGRSLHRGLKPLALFALVFTASASGPYGLEETVPTAGPGLAILVLVAMAFVWGGPYALIIAELVSAIPEKGCVYRLSVLNIRPS